MKDHQAKPTLTELAFKLLGIHNKEVVANWHKLRRDQKVYFLLKAIKEALIRTKTSDKEERTDKVIENIDKRLQEDEKNGLHVLDDKKVDRVVLTPEAPKELPVVTNYGLNLVKETPVTKDIKLESTVPSNGLTAAGEAPKRAKRVPSGPPKSIKDKEKTKKQLEKEKVAKSTTTKPKAATTVTTRKRVIKAKKPE